MSISYHQKICIFDAVLARITGGENSHEEIEKAREESGLSKEQFRDCMDAAWPKDWDEYRAMQLLVEEYAAGQS